MDLDTLLRFLSTLEPAYETATHYWSGLHPDGRRLQTYGTLEEMLPRLVQRNDEGFGIFTTVNAMTPRYDGALAKRTKADVHHVRAVVADWDDPNRKITMGMLPLPPTMVVETSPRKYHIYWCCDDVPLEMFEQIQRGIAQHLLTDRSVIDLPREMRVPGFMHTKGAPQPVKLKLCEPTRRYGPLDLAAAFPFDIKAAIPRERVEVPPLATLTHALVHHWYGPQRPDGGYNVPCPWEAEHTTKSTPTATVYYPPDNDHGPAGYFKCMHNHCAGRCADEYDRWVAAQVKKPAVV